MKKIPQVAETTLIGGNRRQIRVLLDPQRLASRNISASYLVPMLQQANAQTHTGAQDSANTETLLQTGTFFRDADDVARVVVGVFDGRPVYLRDVATVVDGPEEPANYVLYGQGAGMNVGPDLASGPPRTAHSQAARTQGPALQLGTEQAAVTLSVAKRPGRQRGRRRRRRPRQGRLAQGHTDPGRHRRGRDARLRRHREREVERTAPAHGHRRVWCRHADPAVSRLARIARRVAGHPGNARPHAAGFLSLRLHAEPHHAVRADLFHRHPRRRRDRRRRKHRPPHGAAELPAQALDPDRGRGGRRGRQPDDPRHVGRDRRGAANGIRERPDGALHAADPDRLKRRDAVLAARRIRRNAMGGAQGSQGSCQTPRACPGVRRRAGARGRRR